MEANRAAQAAEAGDGKRSRKGLIAGALALLGAEALVKAKSARAGTDGDVVLGVDNGPVTNRTSIRTANWKVFAVLADPNNDGNPYGSIGVWGHGQPYGVVGEADPSLSATGVYGVGSGSGGGVIAQAGPNGGAGVAATSATGFGLYALSGTTLPVFPVGFRPGVLGATDSASDPAVVGNNVCPVAGQGGPGVVGSTDSDASPAVSGQNDGAGPGVSGTNTSSGVGVLAENTGTGPGLKVSGPALFSRSGTVAIPSGATKATVTPPGGLSSSSLVLAVMQNIAGGVMVKAAVPNPGAGTFQIVLNKAPTAPAIASVAWFIVN